MCVTHWLRPFAVFSSLFLCPSVFLDGANLDPTTISGLLHHAFDQIITAAVHPPSLAPPQQSACDVTVTTGLPYDEFGGSQTCGFEIAGTVTPAPTPRDVILFVTAGRDVPETRYLGRFAVGPGARDWRIPACKGTRYSVAVAGAGALAALDGSKPVLVPRPGQDGVSCVETFEGQR